MTNIYLVRHANALERKNTAIAPLTELGIKQAHLLSERFSKYNLHIIYTSPYQRSRNTAKIISKPHRQKILEMEENLIEVDFKIKKRISLAHFKELKEFFSKTEVEQIENLLKAQKRALRLIKFLLKTHPANNVLVVTHGNIIKAIVLGLLELKLTRFQSFIISEASLTKISGTTLEDTRIMTLNDVSHLDSLNKGKSIHTSSLT